MGIADRDYMRRGSEHDSTEDAASSRLLGFLKNHPRLPAVIIGILAAVLILIVVALMLQ